MRALTLQSLGGFEAVSVKAVPMVEPQAGEVRVAVKAAALNHRELWIMQGQYPDVVLPTTMGCDGAGIVDAVGSGVDSSMIGREVVIYPGVGWGDDPAYPSRTFALLGMPGPGTVADAIIVAAESIVDKPAHLGWDEAAAVPLAALTAWRALFTKAALKSGDRLLVTGAGGGVATFAVLFGAAIGAEVYVTSSSDATIAKAVALGAVAGFNYRAENWTTALPRSSRGFNVVLDSAPASGYPAYSRSLATGARVVICGSTGGVTFSVNSPELFLKNLHIHGSNCGTLAEFETMMAFIAEHKIKPVIDRSFPLEQAKEALMYLEKGHAFGKVVVMV